MNLNLITSMLNIIIRSGAALLLATLGEILAQRAGVLNLGLEGILLVSAASGFAAAFHSQNVVLGILTAIASGALLGGIHAFLVVTLKTKQTVTGIAMWLFASGVASLFGQRLGPNGGPLVGLVGPKLSRLPIPWFSRLPLIGRPFFHQDLVIYSLYFLVPSLWFWIYKTRPGLYLRVAGENPAALDVWGISVEKIRYLYTMLGGGLVGLAGGYFSLSYTPGWTEGLTGGRGWIAIALVIFSGWNPVRAVWGALLFGGVSALQLRLQAAGLKIPVSLLDMSPYFATILVLVFISQGSRKKQGTPAALGTPYLRE